VAAGALSVESGVRHAGDPPDAHDD
jgi:hypothetical protein